MAPLLGYGLLMGGGRCVHCSKLFRRADQTERPVGLSSDIGRTDQVTYAATLNRGPPPGKGWRSKALWEIPKSIESASRAPLVGAPRGQTQATRPALRDKPRHFFLEKK